jgi:hypothetical protein
MRALGGDLPGVDDPAPINRAIGKSRPRSRNRCPRREGLCRQDNCKFTKDERSRYVGSHTLLRPSCRDLASN